VVRRTEHGAHEWVKWNPPHHIQKNTIDPLLKTANEHFKQLKEEEREKAARELEQGDDNDDGNDDGDDDDEVDIDAELMETQETSEVAEAGTVERTAEKEKLEKERMEKAEKERMERELKVRRRTDYNARKTRRQRNAMVSGGGYALLDKVRDETGRGQVGIYEDDITFDESALNAQAKLILKRNDRANRYRPLHLLRVWCVSCVLCAVLGGTRTYDVLARAGGWMRMCTTTRATMIATMTRSATKRRLSTWSRGRPRASWASSSIWRPPPSAELKKTTTTSPPPSPSRPPPRR
jgi:hypothetical protein